VHWLDIVFLVPILLAAWRGFRRGLILELASLVGLLLGIFAGWKFSHFASAFLQSELEIQSEHLPILSFALTFLVVVLLVFLLGKVLERIIKLMALSMLNKLAGLLFSSLKVVVIISVLLVIIMQFNSDFEWIDQEGLEKSQAFKILHDLGELILPEFKSALSEVPISS